MSLTKEKEISKIEIVQTWFIQVRTDTVVKENDTEISRTHTATDISSEDASVQAIANVAWTDTVKNNYKTWRESQGL